MSEFVFPSAYGGAVKSENPPQIHDMMKQLRVEIGAVEAKRQAGGPLFPVRGAKDLAQKLANALNKLNMEAPVVAQEVTLCDVSNLPKNENAKGNPVFRTLAHVKATVRLIAPDTSFIDLVGSGHGGDVDDKSGGKASTYAWKDAILKGLSIPHEDMVDTDDDSSTGERESAGNRAKGGAGAKEGGKNAASGTSGGSAKAVAGGEQPDVVGGKLVPGGGAAENGGVLGEVAARIAAASSEASLEAIRDDIKSGKYDLHGSERLKATQLWVARKKEIKS